jgi:predicted ester cyclase
VSVSENSAAVERARKAWNAGDLDGYLQLYDDSIKLYGYSPEPLDRAAVRAFYEGIFRAFPGPQLVFHDVFGAGDRICIVFTMTGRHEGAFMEVDPTGREIALDGITVLRFENVKCVERWSQANMLGLLVQLGALPPPA